MPEAPVAVAAPIVEVESEQLIQQVKFSLCEVNVNKNKDGVMLNLKSEKFHAFFKESSGGVHGGSISRKQLYLFNGISGSFAIDSTKYLLSGESTFLQKNDPSGNTTVNMAVLRAVTLDSGVDLQMSGMYTQDTLALWCKQFQAGCLYLYTNFMKPVSFKVNINVTSVQ